MPPAVAFDLIKGLVMLKVSPLLIGQILKVVKTTTVPAGMCPQFVWPFELSRISAPLANQIMAQIARLLGS